MNCSRCGASLGPGAQFCSSCGETVAPYAPPVSGNYAGGLAAVGLSRVSRHLQVLGVLWIVYAFERTVSKLVGLSVLHGLLSGRLSTPTGLDFGPMGRFGWGVFWPVIAVSLVFVFILCLLTGYALLTRQPWARILAIVVSILALFHPLLGTALGIYTLWVLAPSTSGQEYEGLASAAHRG